MRDLAGEGTPWQLLGWFGFIAGYVMVTYYITIVADVLFLYFQVRIRRAGCLFR